MADDRIVRIEDKLDRVSDRLSSIDSTLAAQHESLVNHIRRTEILETKMEPVQKHVAMVGGVLKFIGLVASLGVIIEVILMIVK